MSVGVGVGVTGWRAEERPSTSVRRSLAATVSSSGASLLRSCFVIAYDSQGVYNSEAGLPRGLAA